MERSLDQAAGPIQLENHPANFVVLSGKASDLGVQLDAWTEPLKWHTKSDTVSGKGNDSEEKEILPEISAHGRGADEDVRKRG